jgi:exonuclease SbcD
MKLAVSADLHLLSEKETPDRYNALQNVLDLCVEQEVTYVFLAGDVFDKELQDFSDFEKLCGRKKYSGLSIYLTRGNHDVGIKDDYFTLGNLKVIERPMWLEIDNGYQLLIIPYEKERVMGEVIEKNRPKEEVEKWILVGHGDWVGGFRVKNSMEPGVYMPLTGKDILKYRPSYVFLGHIHEHMISDRVCYPGSPCSLDISETGKRHFLIFNTDDGKVTERKIDTDRIYFDETILILPGENEGEQFSTQFKKLVERWELDKSELKKVVLRLSLKGYTKDRRVLEKAVADVAEIIQMYEKPNLDNLYISEDLEREFLIRQFKNELASLSFAKGEDEPDFESVLDSALRLVYED